jgi:hypothetical protein
LISEVHFRPEGIDTRSSGELVKDTHKEQPKREDLTELRSFFDEDPELWQRLATWPRARWITPYHLKLMQWTRRIGLQSR